MIVNKELIDKIRNYFDLNIYETKVWLALVSKGIASAGEIAEISEVPRSRTYDVLESLEKDGFAIAKIGKPTKYIAVKPETVLEKMKRNAFHNADERVKILEDLKGREEYEKLTALYNNSFNGLKREEVSGAIKGKKNIFVHAKQILDNAENEVILCLPAKELLEKEKDFKKIFKKLKDNGIKVELALNGNDEELKRVNKEFGIKPKKTESHSRFVIADNTQALMNITNPHKTPEDQDFAIWLNSEFFSTAFTSLVRNNFNN